MNKTPERSVEEILEEFNSLAITGDLDLDARTYGDGHYCTHHPDDPAHSDECYQHPATKWLTKTLQAERQKCEEAVEAEYTLEDFCIEFKKEVNANPEMLSALRQLTQPNNHK